MQTNSLVEALLNEVARPRMPDAQAFVDAHGTEVGADGHETAGNDTKDGTKGSNKDRSRRADPAPGEAEEKYKKLQGDDKSAKALAAYGRKVRDNERANKHIATTGGNNIEYAHEVIDGPQLDETTIAVGVLSKDPSKAAIAKKALKRMLDRPLSADAASDQLPALFNNAALFDAIENVAKNEGGSADVRQVVRKFLKTNSVNLNEALIVEFAVDPLSTVMPLTQGVDECWSYRSSVSTAISDLILSRRSLNTLMMQLDHHIGDTERGQKAVAAVEEILKDHSDLIRSLLEFEDEFCTQDFVDEVRQEMGLDGIEDLEDI